MKVVHSTICEGNINLVSAIYNSCFAGNEDGNAIFHSNGPDTGVPELADPGR